MDKCPKDEATAKNLVCKKALPIPEKNWKNLLGGGVASTPLGHRRVNINCFARFLNFAEIRAKTDFAKFL